MRQFEKLSIIKQDIALPKRSTVKSAGYDISIIHPEIWKMMQNPEYGSKTLDELWEYVKELKLETFYLPSDKENYLFPTGIKASMENDEVLMLFIRSSVGVKQLITLSNQVAVIDADYYNNPDNEGHIFIPLNIPKRRMPDKEQNVFTPDAYNFARYLTFDKPTMRICQGIFLNYNITYDDDTSDKRIGGLGSTGQ